MKAEAWRIELELLPTHPDPVGEKALAALLEGGLEINGKVRSGRGFLLPGDLAAADIELIAHKLLADPVTEAARLVAPGEISGEGSRLLIVRRHPGVADPEGQDARRALQLLPERSIAVDHIESYRTFRVEGQVPNGRFLEIGSRVLTNPTIEDAHLGTQALQAAAAPTPGQFQRSEVPLAGLSAEQLLRLSQERGLALTTEEMTALQRFYKEEEDREPTDVELETYAQTWSEHCKHKTLTGPVEYVEYDQDGQVSDQRRYRNLLKETVFAATQRLSPDWCWSVFKDNAGVVALTDDIGIAVKVETHNHPSALEPYGGAGTGIGGVIRDILGTGRGARPFASTDVFCVGPADLPNSELPPGTMHPNRILEGVVSGVRDYGNRMGIPTVAGTVLRHPGYVGNPLVFAGSIGEIPRECVEKEVHAGDFILALGGRTGRDGIHGATFSSEALHEESEAVDATAVQIGDPIVEKKVLDVLMLARDRNLFRAVTDCGAGGFSSAVGEMGAGDAERNFPGGAEVELADAPLKYPGLSYAEVWISEAQERMVLAVPPECVDELLALSQMHDVEAVKIGTFTDSGRLRLYWHGQLVGDMPMDFLHEGVPQPIRKATWKRPAWSVTAWPETASYEELLLRVLAHPSVASKESIVRQYDHEVQGGTQVKPYQGKNGHGPSDGTVVKPRLERREGVAIGCGIAPRIGELDAYAGAACAIDEAIRNVVACGGNPHRVAILDNFCWGDCRKPDRFGALVRAADACYDAAIAYGAPFISGKDSLNNEYRVGTVEKAIPPTLLCTAVAPLADAAKAVTTDFKRAGNPLILLGSTGANGGGAVIADLLQLPDSQPLLPDLSAAPALLDALHTVLSNGWAVACHDLSEGGLAVAAAEMMFGSNFGARIQLAQVSLHTEGHDGSEETQHLIKLFNETPTRFLLEVDPQHLEQVATAFRTQPHAVVGEVIETPVLEVYARDQVLLQSPLAEMAAANAVPLASHPST